MGALLSLGALWSLGPRIIIPMFFVSQKVNTLDDPVDIAKTIAFSVLFITSVVMAFSAEPWLSLIPGIAAWAYWNMIYDKPRLEVYRYTDWAMTTPLMLLAILLANKASLTTIVAVLLADGIMIGTGYLGSQATDNTNKLALFALGCAALVPILYILSTMKKAKYAIYLTLILWCLYPLVWYADEEALVTKQTSNITYSVMDVITKVGLVNLLHL